MENGNQLNVKSSFVEKLGYGIQALGTGGFFWTFISGFITLYYTNSVLLSAAAVGTMMLIARVLDGLSDVIMGIILERTNSRMGKCRFWMLIATPMLAVSLLLAFHVPSVLSDGGKMIYVFLTYVFVSAIAFTVYGVPEGAAPARMSSDPADIRWINVFKIFMSTGASTFVYSIANKILAVNGGNTVQAGWTKIVFLYAAITAVSAIVGVACMRDKFTNAVTEDAALTEKVPLKTALKACAFQVEFWLLLGIFLCSYMLSGISGSGMMYYYGYVLKNWNMITPASAGNTIFCLAATVVTPVLCKKIGQMKVLRAAVLLMAGCSVLRLLAPGTLGLYMACTWLQSGFSMVLNTLQWVLLAELILFIAKKTGIRNEGFISMISSIGIKIGTGLGSAIVGWLLAWGKFDGSSAIQSLEAQNAIIWMNIGIPSVIGAIAFVLVMFWRVDKKISVLTE